MSEANWPVRVGGEYKAVSSEKITRRVLAIDGDSVHSKLWFKGEDSSYGADILPLSVFRKLSHPQDQSSIYDLLAALIAAKNWINSANFTIGPTEESLIEQIDSAISRAEEGVRS